MRPRRLAALIALTAAATLPARAADIVEQIAATVPQHAHSYAETMTVLQQLHGTERVRCWKIGTTPQGRTIAMAVAHDPQQNPRGLRRLMVIARQHGNEPAGTEASLALLRHLSSGEGRAESALLRHLALLVVPMANPDGAARSRRRNANGADLNRDWAGLTQPETRAIEAAFDEWRPHAVIDLHELPASSSKPSYQENFVETIASCGSLPAALGTNCERTSGQVSVWMGRYGIPLNCYYDTPGDDVRLCHRHFGLTRGVPAFLFESKTGRGRSLRERARYHILGMLVVANQVAYHHDEEPGAVQMAAAPVVDPAESVPQPPRRTSVALGDPQPAAADGRMLLSAHVVDGEDDFAYVTFEVGGRMVALTNAAPYEYALDTATCPAGAVEVAARAHDSAGRCIATDLRTMTLAAPAATLGE